MNTDQLEKSQYKAEVAALAKEAERLRVDKEMPLDTSLFDLFAEKHSDDKLTGTDLLADMGINTGVDTIENIVSSSDVAVNFLMPEIYRDAINVGLRKAPIYPNIIASEQSLGGVKVTMPAINMSDADAKYVGEGETIQFGNVSYGSKEIKIRKMGRGIQITDEVRLYSTLNVVSLFLKDFGTRLGYGLDTLAIDTLLNGEQADGSESAPVIGVGTANTLTYKDILRVWIRLARMGKTPGTMLGGEAIALLMLDLPEFKNRQNTGPTVATLDVKTPIPNSSSIFIHSGISDTQVIIMDPRSTLLKFNSRPLLVETERVASNQTEASYATITTGFAIMFRDSRVVLDYSLAYGTYGFPAYMNVDVLASSTIK